MKVLLIPDKFKGSLSAKEVIDAIGKGLKKACPKVELYPILASDGGDGFLNAVSENVKCDKVETETVDPFGRTTRATYLIGSDKKKAFIELAKASGLELLSKNELNAMLTSTYGTGLQIKDALSRGAKSIYLGLGGSATNDGGIGIAHALGYEFLDGLGHVLHPIGKNLSHIHKIRFDQKNVDLKGSCFYAVNDVDNPLYGPNGAAYTYGKQKGGDAHALQILDNGLKHLDHLVKKQLHKDVAEIPGSGAAGGTAYGLKVFLNAEFISGIDFILNLAKVDKLLEEHRFDYIITGEGKFDDQTLRGKLIKGVLDLGKRHNIPVVAICGQLTVTNGKLVEMGLHRALEVQDTSKSLAYNMEQAAGLIENSIYTLFKHKV